MGSRRLWAELRHERELRQQAAKYDYRALRLRTAHVERRLEELNHVNERADAFARESVSRDVFTRYVDTNRENLASALALVSKDRDVARASLLGEITPQLAIIAAEQRKQGDLIKQAIGAVNVARFIGVGGIVGVAIGLYGILGPK